MKKLLLFLMFLISISLYSAELITFYTELPVDSLRYKTVEARLKEAFSRIGYDFELVNSPDLKALKTANSKGDGDAYRTANLKEIQAKKSKNLIRINVPIRSEAGYSVYTFKEKNKTIESFEDFKAFYANGYVKGNKYLKKNVPYGFEVNSAQQLVRMLNIRKIETIILSEGDREEINIEFRQRMIKIGQIEQEILKYSYIHKKYANLVSSLEKVLKEMKVDGTYDLLNYE